MRIKPTISVLGAGLLTPPRLPTEGLLRGAETCVTPCGSVGRPATTLGPPLFAAVPETGQHVPVHLQFALFNLQF